MSSAHTTTHSCHTLCACQGCAPACPDCTHQQDAATAQALAAAAQASRNTGCCNVLGDELDFKESLTPMERIAYWFGVGIAAGMTVATAFGLVGYLSVKFLGA